MPLGSRGRDLAIGGGILAAAAGAYLLVQRGAVAQGAAAPAAAAGAPIPADTLLPSGAGAGGGGGGGGGGAGSDALSLADITSALAAALDAHQSQAGSGLGHQAPIGGAVGVGTQVPAGQPRTTGPGPSATPIAAHLPGADALSRPDVSYWDEKLHGDLTVVGDPEPAAFLAQWLWVQQHGTFLPGAGADALRIDPNAPGRPVSGQDLAIGVAWSTAYAEQHGVTPDQLAQAQANLATQIAGGNYNLAGGQQTLHMSAGERAVQQATIDLMGPAGHAFTTEQISYINLKGGSTVENLAALKNDPQFAKLGTVTEPQTVAGR